MGFYYDYYLRRLDWFLLGQQLYHFFFVVLPNFFCRRTILFIFGSFLLKVWNDYKKSLGGRQKKYGRTKKSKCFDDKKSIEWRKKNLLWWQKGFFLDLIMTIINWFKNQIVFVYFFGFLKKLVSNLFLSHWHQPATSFNLGHFRSIFCIRNTAVNFNFLCYFTILRINV